LVAVGEVARDARHADLTAAKGSTGSDLHRRGGNDLIIPTGHVLPNAVLMAAFSERHSREVVVAQLRHAEGDSSGDEGTEIVPAKPISAICPASMAFMLEDDARPPLPAGPAVTRGAVQSGD
jgi:hypothetical protein